MFGRAAFCTRNAVRARCARGMATITNFKPPTMAELPVPQGSWKDAYAQKQRKYNLQLLAGILVAGGTLAFAKESGLIVFGFGPKLGK